MTEHHRSRPTRAANKPGGRKSPSLPRVYGDCRRLLDMLIDSMRNFPKEYKYIFGERLVLGATLMAGHAEKAYRNPAKAEKRRHLIAFETEFMQVKTLASIAAERRWIQGAGRAAEVIERIVSVETQAEAWLAAVTESDMQGTAPEREGHG